ncbi:hypothetical protein [Motiliproteus sp. MSK22-1]|uniref:hypothetical protein n=1 Tax=Motiliproteus sp. MSK22-1 TaxID=1897630 RepID=UPI00117F947A|nr:hypothetical protein [Motiliproteus sp. MSK22-1]
MAKNNHPALKQIKLVLLFVSLPTLIFLCYRAYGWVSENTHSAEEVFIASLVLLGSCSLCILIYFINLEEIQFCKEFGLEGEDIQEAQGGTCTSDGGGSHSDSGDGGSSV